MDDTYAYDAAGSRMTRTESGETVAYTLGTGDRLASWTGGAYTHDTAGDVTRIERIGRPALDLVWNSQYQLASVSTNGVFAESYTYDALNRRVSTTTIEGTMRHVYDDSWQAIADLDEQGNVVVSYVWGYVDSQNDVVARWQYDAWGNVIAEDVSVPALARIRYRFQGREWSVATGLTNFRMRWYDPETGRWLSKDSIGLSGGLNLYVFCDGDPVNYLDAGGTFFVPLLMNPWAIAGMVVAGAILYNCAEAMAKIISTVIEEAVETIKEVNHTVMEKRGMIETGSYFHPKGGHSNNIRPSSRNRHEAGERRRKNDQERSRRLNGKKEKEEVCGFRLAMTRIMVTLAINSDDKRVLCNERA